MYSGHIQNATVARISPSGYYCASADITGKGGFRSTRSVGCYNSLILLVNVWDVVGEDQVLKGEYRVISGRMYASQL